MTGSVFFTGASVFTGAVFFTGASVFAGTVFLTGSVFFTGASVFAGAVFFIGACVFTGASFFSATALFTGASFFSAAALFAGAVLGFRFLISSFSSFDLVFHISSDIPESKRSASLQFGHFIFFPVPCILYIFLHLPHIYIICSITVFQFSHS